MRSGKEHELSGSGGGDQHPFGGSSGGAATPHPKAVEGAHTLADEETVPSRASTSLEQWEAQSVDKPPQSSFPIFEEDDDRGLSKTFRLSIMLGSGLMMLAVVLCLVLVLPRASHKSTKHDNSTKLILLHQVDYVNIYPSQHRLLSIHNQHRDTHYKHDEMGFVSPVITSACSAVRFPDICQASLVLEPSANSSTTVTAVVDSALEISRMKTLSLRLVSQDLLKASDNINLTTAARDCAYLLDRASSFIAKCQATPFAEQALWQVADAQAWMSAALTYENDCRSALSYVNTTQAVDHLMGQLDYAIALTSNALSMVDALRAFGNNTHAWVPPTRLTVYDAVSPPSEGGGDWGDWWQKPAITVAIDGSGNYTSVQAAVDAAPEGATKWFTIKVRAGTYSEVVRIPTSKTKLALVGEGMGKTIITGNYNAQMPGVTTYDSATVAVDGDGFVAVGITFENTAGPEKHQAVALRVDSDFAAFYNCSFLGYQDTLYVHSLRQFYRGCRIEGTIDFIFGNAGAFFQECDILVRPGLTNVGTSVVTAQGRTDPGETSALVFHHCRLNGTLPFLEAMPRGHSSYLGRPWKAFSRTILLECILGGFFRPEGWLPWNGDFALDTLFYGEYLSSGPGASPSTRVSWSTQLSNDMALQFTLAPLIQGDRWLPATNIPFSLSL